MNWKMENSTRFLRNFFIFTSFLSLILLLRILDLTSSQRKQLQQHENRTRNFGPLKIRARELESDQIFEQPCEKNEVDGPEEFMHRLKVLQIHSKDHDEAEIRVEDVSAEKYQEKFEPVIDRLWTLISIAMVQVVVGSVVDWRCDREEIAVAVECECEKNRKYEEGNQIDENLEWSYPQPAANLDHLEVGSNFISLVVVGHL
jgi:hypothetical protein